MRVNLVVPFQDRDKAKTLGARWDTTLRVWYVVNHPDLRRLARWLPGVAEFYRRETVASQQNESGMPVQPTRTAANAQTVLPTCGCDALPWEHCEHTRGN